MSSLDCCFISAAIINFIIVSFKNLFRLGADSGIFENVDNVEESSFGDSSKKIRFVFSSLSSLSILSFVMLFVAEHSVIFKTDNCCAKMYFHKFAALADFFVSSHFLKNYPLNPFRFFNFDPRTKIICKLFHRYWGSGCNSIDLHYSHRFGQSTLSRTKRKVCCAISSTMKKQYLNLMNRYGIKLLKALKNELISQIV